MSPTAPTSISSTEHLDSSQEVPLPEAPSYGEGRVEGQLWATFSNGSSVRVGQGRERAYPGLVSECPSTAPFYAEAAEYLRGASRVLDVGSGSGQGTVALRRCFAEVVGIEADPHAVEFASQFARTCNVLPAGLSGVTFVASNLSACPLLAKADAAVLVDVLGHVISPLPFLRAVRSLLGRGAKVWLGEPLAAPGQYLRNPARRAFSGRSLEALLVQSGFEVTACDDAPGPFLVVCAEAIEERACESYWQGEQLRQAERLPEALAAFQRAEREGGPELLLEALLAQGECAWRMRMGDQAIQCFFRARDLDESDPRAAAALARACLAMGEDNDALEIMRGVQRVDPTDLSMACVRAQIAEKLFPRSALPHWLVASNLAPDQFDIALKVAEVASSQGDHDTGLFALERVRGFGDAHGGNLHVAIASALYNAGRLEDCLLEAREAKTLFADNPMVIDLCQQLSHM